MLALQAPKVTRSEKGQVTVDLNEVLGDWLVDLAHQFANDEKGNLLRALAVLSAAERALAQGPSSEQSYDVLHTQFEDSLADLKEELSIPDSFLLYLSPVAAHDLQHDLRCAIDKNVTAAISGGVQEGAL